MRKRLVLGVVFMPLLFGGMGRAQVPEAHGTCVSGCGSSSGSGSGYNPYAARAAARLSDQRREFDKVKHHDDSALKKARDLFHRGRDERDPCKAADEFQQSLNLVQSTDVSTPGGIWDGPLQGDYIKLQVRHSENLRVTSEHLNSARSDCAQWQARLQAQASASSPANNAPQAPENFRAEAATNGVYSCYRADPDKVGCFELRNNSERRVRLYVDGLPGVQCTVEPHSFCSLPMALGHLQLRMAADDEKGAGPIVSADVEVVPSGTRLNLAAARQEAPQERAAEKKRR